MQKYFDTVVVDGGIGALGPRSLLIKTHPGEKPANYLSTMVHRFPCDVMTTTVTRKRKVEKMVIEKFNAAKHKNIDVPKDGYVLIPQLTEVDEEETVRLCRVHGPLKQRCDPTIKKKGVYVDILRLYGYINQLEHRNTRKRQGSGREDRHRVEKVEVSNKGKKRKNPRGWRRWRCLQKVEQDDTESTFTETFEESAEEEEDEDEVCIPPDDLFADIMPPRRAPVDDPESKSASSGYSMPPPARPWQEIAAEMDAKMDRAEAWIRKMKEEAGYHSDAESPVEDDGDQAPGRTNDWVPGQVERMSKTDGEEREPESTKPQVVMEPKRPIVDQSDAVSSVWSADSWVPGQIRQAPVDEEVEDTHGEEGELESTKPQVIMKSNRPIGDQSDVASSVWSADSWVPGQIRQVPAVEGVADPETKEPPRPQVGKPEERIGDHSDAESSIWSDDSWVPGQIRQASEELKEEEEPEPPKPRTIINDAEDNIKKLRKVSFKNHKRVSNERKNVRKVRMPTKAKKEDLRHCRIYKGSYFARETLDIFQLYYYKRKNPRTGKKMGPPSAPVPFLMPKKDMGMVRATHILKNMNHQACGQIELTIDNTNYGLLSLLRAILNDKERSLKDRERAFGTLLREGDKVTDYAPLWQNIQFEPVVDEPDKIRLKWTEEDTTTMMRSMMMTLLERITKSKKDTMKEHVKNSIAKMVKDEWDDQEILGTACGKVMYRCHNRQVILISEKHAAAIVEEYNNEGWIDESGNVVAELLEKHFEQREEWETKTGKTFDPTKYTQMHERMVRNGIMPEKQRAMLCKCNFCGNVSVNVDTDEGFCPWCLEDIFLTFEEIISRKFLNVVEPYFREHYGARSLYESKLMGTLDGMGWATSEAFGDVATNYDSRMVRNILSRYTYKLVSLPNGLEQNVISELQHACPLIEFHGIPTWRRVDANEYATMGVLANMVAAVTPPDHTLLISRRSKDGMAEIVLKATQIVPIEDSVKGRKHTRILTPYDWHDQMDEASIASMFKQYGNYMATILPVGESTSLRVTENEVLFSSRAMNLPSTLPKHTYRLLMSDVLRLGDDVYVGTKSRTLQNYQLTIWVKINTLQNFIKMEFVPEFDDKMEFVIPKISSTALLNAVVPLVLTKENVKLDRKIMQSMLTRALKPGTDFEAMIDYGVGLAHSTYSKYDRVVADNNYSAEDIVNHAYCAFIMAQRMRARSAVLIGASGRQEKTLTKVLLPFMDQIVQWVIKKVNNFINLQSTSELIRESTLNTIRHSGNDPTWDAVFNWIERRTVRMYNINGQTDFHHEIDDYCAHHSNCGKKHQPHKMRPCVCCVWAEALENSDRCACCTSMRVLICGHPLSSMDNKETDKANGEDCDCCGRTMAGPCWSCHLEQIIHDIEEQDVLTHAAMEQLTVPLSTPKSDIKVTPKQRQQKPYLKKIEIGGQVISAWQNTEAQSLTGMTHRHTCPRCQHKYDHTHNYNSLKHPAFDEDCPVCYPNVKMRNKGVEVTIGGVESSEVPGQSNTMRAEQRGSKSEPVGLTSTESRRVHFRPREEEFERVSDTSEGWGDDPLMARTQQSSPWPTPAETLPMAQQVVEAEVVVPLTQEGVTHSIPEADSADRTASVKDSVDTYADILNRQEHKNVATIELEVVSKFETSAALWLTVGYDAWLQSGHSIGELDRGDGFTNVPFMPLGETIASRETLEVLVRNDTANVSATCGYDALRSVLGRRIDINSMVNITGKTQWWNREDLVNVSTAMRFNLLIITNMTTRLYNNISGEPFVSLLLTERGSELHWMSCTVRWNMHPSHIQRFTPNMDETEYSQMANRLGVANDCDGVDRMRLELAMKERSKIVDDSQMRSGMPVVRKIAGDYFYTNNQKGIHDVRNGLVHIYIHESAITPMSHVNMQSSMLPTMDSSVLITDLTKEEMIKWNKLVEANLKLSVHELHLVTNANNKSIPQNYKSKLVHKPVKVSRAIGKTLLELEVGDLKLKTFDMISIPDRDEMVVIKVSAGKITVPYAKWRPSTSSITIGVPDISSGSSVRRIVSTLRQAQRQVDINSLLTGARCVLGVGGSGKTKTMVEEYSPDNAYMTMTNVARNVLIQRLNVEKGINVGHLRGQVKTLEAWTIDGINKQTLVIDEATMLQTKDLMLVLNDKIKSLEMFGDKSQIGAVNYSKMMGDRPVMDITQFPAVRETRWKSWRQGQPLVSELNEIDELALMRSASEELVTSYLTYYMDELNLDEISELVETNEVQVVLCHYQKTKTQLLTYFRALQSRVVVETIHAYQGNENDVIMIIQTPASKTQTTGIHLDTQYNISAVERARKLVIWVSVGCYREETRLSTRIAGYRAAGLHTAIEDNTLYYHVGDMADAAAALERWQRNRALGNPLRVRMPLQQMMVWHRDALLLLVAMQERDSMPQQYWEMIDEYRQTRHESYNILNITRVGLPDDQVEQAIVTLATLPGAEAAQQVLDTEQEVQETRYVPERILMALQEARPTDWHLQYMTWLIEAAVNAQGRTVATLDRAPLSPMMISWFENKVNEYTDGITIDQGPVAGFDIQVLVATKKVMFVKVEIMRLHISNSGTRMQRGTAMHLVPEKYLQQLDNLVEIVDACAILSELGYINIGEIEQLATTFALDEQHAIAVCPESVRSLFADGSDDASSQTAEDEGPPSQQQETQGGTNVPTPRTPMTTHTQGTTQYTLMTRAQMTPQLWSLISREVRMEIDVLMRNGYVPPDPDLVQAELELIIDTSLPTRRSLDRWVNTLVHEDLAPFLRDNAGLLDGEGDEVFNLEEADPGSINQDPVGFVRALWNVETLSLKWSTSAVRERIQFATGELKARLARLQHFGLYLNEEDEAIHIMDSIYVLATLGPHKFDEAVNAAKDELENMYLSMIDLNYENGSTTTLPGDVSHGDWHVIRYLQQSRIRSLADLEDVELVQDVVIEYDSLAATLQNYGGRRLLFMRMAELLAAACPNVKSITPAPFLDSLTLFITPDSGIDIFKIRRTVLDVVSGEERIELILDIAWEMTIASITFGRDGEATIRSTIEHLVPAELNVDARRIRMALNAMTSYLRLGRLMSSFGLRSYTQIGEQLKIYLHEGGAEVPEFFKNIADVSQTVDGRFIIVMPAVSRNRLMKRSGSQVRPIRPASTDGLLSFNLDHTTEDSAIDADRINKKRGVWVSATEVDHETVSEMVFKIDFLTRLRRDLLREDLSARPTVRAMLDRNPARVGAYGRLCACVNQPGENAGEHVEQIHLLHNISDGLDLSIRPQTIPVWSMLNAINHHCLAIEEHGGVPLINFGGDKVLVLSSKSQCAPCSSLTFMRVHRPVMRDGSYGDCTLEGVVLSIGSGYTAPYRPVAHDGTVLALKLLMMIGFNTWSTSVGTDGTDGLTSVTGRQVEKEINDMMPFLPKERYSLLLTTLYERQIDIWKIKYLKSLITRGIIELGERKWANERKDEIRDLLLHTNIMLPFLISSRPRGSKFMSLKAMPILFITDRKNTVYISWAMKKYAVEETLIRSPLVQGGDEQLLKITNRLDDLGFEVLPDSNDLYAITATYKVPNMMLVVENLVRKHVGEARRYGANSILDQTILGMAHSDRNDRVVKHIQTFAAMLETKKLVDTEHLITADENTINTYGDHIKSSYPMVPIAQSTQHEPRLALTTVREQMHLYAVYWNAGKRPVTIYGEHPSAVAGIHPTMFRYMPPTEVASVTYALEHNLVMNGMHLRWDKDGEVEEQDNSALGKSTSARTIRARELRNEQLAVNNGPIFYTTRQEPVRNEPTSLTTALWSMEPEELCLMLGSLGEIYAYLPTSWDDHLIGETEEIVATPDTSDHFRMLKAYQVALRSDGLCITDQGRCLFELVASDEMQITLVCRLVVEPKVLLSMPADATTSRDYMSISIPDIEVMVDKIVSGGPVIKQRKIVISKRLFRLLTIRCVRSDADFDTIERYAKVQMQTRYYATSSVYNKYNIRSDVGHDTAVAAWLYTRPFLESVRTIKPLFARDNVGLASDWLSALVGVVGANIDMLKDLAGGIVSAAIQYCGLDASPEDIMNIASANSSDWRSTIDELIKSMHKLDVQMLSDKRSMSRYYYDAEFNMKKMQTDVEHEAGHTPITNTLIIHSGSRGDYMRMDGTARQMMTAGASVINVLPQDITPGPNDLQSTRNWQMAESLSATSGMAHWTTHVTSRDKLDEFMKLDFGPNMHDPAFVDNIQTVVCNWYDVNAIDYAGRHGKRLVLCTMTDMSDIGPTVWKLVSTLGLTLVYVPKVLRRLVADKIMNKNVTISFGGEMDFIFKGKVPTAMVLQLNLRRLKLRDNNDNDNHGLRVVYVNTTDVLEMDNIDLNSHRTVVVCATNVWPEVKYRISLQGATANCRIETTLPNPMLENVVKVIGHSSIAMWTYAALCGLELTVIGKTLDELDTKLLTVAGGKRTSLGAPEWDVSAAEQLRTRAEFMMDIANWHNTRIVTGVVVGDPDTAEKRQHQQTMTPGRQVDSYIHMTNGIMVTKYQASRNVGYYCECDLADNLHAHSLYDCPHDCVKVDDILTEEVMRSLPGDPTSHTVFEYNGRDYLYQPLLPASVDAGDAYICEECHEEHYRAADICIVCVLAKQYREHIERVNASIPAPADDVTLLGDDEEKEELTEDPEATRQEEGELQLMIRKGRKVIRPLYGIKESDKVVAFSGHSGAGKSTLIKRLMQLLNAEETELPVPNAVESLTPPRVYKIDDNLYFLDSPGFGTITVEQIGHSVDNGIAFADLVVVCTRRPTLSVVEEVRILKSAGLQVVMSFNAEESAAKNDLEEEDQTPANIEERILSNRTQLRKMFRSWWNELTGRKLGALDIYFPDAARINRMVRMRNKNELIAPDDARFVQERNFLQLIGQFDKVYRRYEKLPKDKGGRPKSPTPEPVAGPSRIWQGYDATHESKIDAFMKRMRQGRELTISRKIKLEDTQSYQGSSYKLEAFDYMTSYDWYNRGMALVSYDDSVPSLWTTNRWCQMVPLEGGIVAIHDVCEHKVGGIINGTCWRLNDDYMDYRAHISGAVLFEDYEILHIGSKKAPERESGTVHAIEVRDDATQAEADIETQGGPGNAIGEQTTTRAQGGMTREESWNTAMTVLEQEVMMVEYEPEVTLGVDGSSDSNQLQKCGVHTFRAERVVLLHDPSGNENDCVIDVILFALGKLGDRSEKFQLQQQMQDIRGVTKKELIQLSLYMRFNLVIVEDEQATAIRYADWPLVQCQLTHVGGVGHCRCVRVVSNNEFDNLDFEVMTPQKVTRDSSEWVRCNGTGPYLLTQGHTRDHFNHIHVSQVDVGELLKGIKSRKPMTTLTLLDEKTLSDQELENRYHAVLIRYHGRNVRHIIKPQEIVVEGVYTTSRGTTIISANEWACRLPVGAVVMVMTSTGPEPGLVISQDREMMITEVLCNNQQVMQAVVPLRTGLNGPRMRQETGVTERLAFANMSTMLSARATGRDYTGIEIRPNHKRIIIDSYDNERHHNDGGLRQNLSSSDCVMYSIDLQPSDIANRIKWMLNHPAILLVKGRFYFKPIAHQVLESVGVETRGDVDLNGLADDAVEWNVLSISEALLTIVANRIMKADNKGRLTKGVMPSLLIHFANSAKIQHSSMLSKQSRPWRQLANELAGWVSHNNSRLSQPAIRQALVISEWTMRIDRDHLVGVLFCLAESRVPEVVVDVREDGQWRQAESDVDLSGPGSRLGIQIVLRTQGGEFILSTEPTTAGSATMWTDTPDHDPRFLIHDDPDKADSTWRIGGIKKLVSKYAPTHTVVTEQQMDELMYKFPHLVMPYTRIINNPEMRGVYPMVSERLVNVDQATIKEIMITMRKTAWYRRSITRPQMMLFTNLKLAATVGWGTYHSLSGWGDDAVMKKALQSAIKEMVESREVDIKADFGSIDALQTWEMQTVLNWQETPDGQAAVQKQYRPKIDLEFVADCMSGVGVAPDVPTEVMAAWEDADWTDKNNRILPNRDMRISDSAEVAGFKEITKATMTTYPIVTRPVMHNAANSLFNALTTRIADGKSLRKSDLVAQVEVDRIIDNMFIKNARQIAADYRANPVGLNGSDTRRWLESRPGVKGIADEVDKILSEGFDLHRMNELKIHAKLESLFKTVDRLTLRNSPDRLTLRSERTRLIVWQAKGLCALFAPMFLKLKERLKSLLNEKVVYADGYTPTELNETMYDIPNEAYVIESDLEKQDRQTDHQDLDIEFGIYSFLGAHPTALSMWRVVHHSWRMKGETVRAFGEAMRMTGQATTALGNVIINLAVHSRWFARNKENVIRIYVLGDDFMGFTKAETSTEMVRSETARFYNMYSKVGTSSHGGTFLQMIAYHTPEGHYSLGPNFTRLRNKYEVTSGVSAMNDGNLEARCMSYCMMIGDCKDVQDVIRAKNLPIEPVVWYNTEAVIRATALLHKSNEESVRNDRQLLIGYLKQESWTEHKFLVPVIEKF